MFEKSKKDINQLMSDNKAKQSALKKIIKELEQQEIKSNNTNSKK